MTTDGGASPYFLAIDDQWLMSKVDLPMIDGF
jgi:hypothetical protein